MDRVVDVAVGDFLRVGGDGKARVRMQAITTASTESQADATASITTLSVPPRGWRRGGTLKARQRALLPRPLTRAKFLTRRVEELERDAGGGQPPRGRR